MKIQLDTGSMHIIKTLQNQGFEAYLVGGSVRNALLKGTTTDFDITTSATPEDIMALFTHTIPTGLQHGTVTIVLDHVPYEVTTYRTEGEYLDARHPSSVQFVRDLDLDLMRRDFTINAMAYNPITGDLVDRFGGREDLRIRMIRAVGNPSERFHEDALRIIRGIRFASQLNFNIEANTFKAMAELSRLLSHVSQERIYSELKGILMAPTPSVGIEMMLYTGALEVLLPELLPMAGFNQFSPYHDRNVFFHTMEVLDRTRAYLPLRLAALFHDTGKPHTFTMDDDGRGHFYGHEEASLEIAREVMERLKVDNKTRDTTLLLVGKHMTSLEMKKPVKIKRLIREFGKEDINLFFEFKEADMAGKSSYAIKYNKFTALKAKVDEIIENEEALDVKDLEISGRELIQMGYPKGPVIGEVLDILLQEVLANASLNSNDYLMERAQQLQEDHLDPGRH